MSLRGKGESNDKIKWTRGYGRTVTIRPTKRLRRYNDTTYEDEDGNLWDKWGNFAGAAVQTGLALSHAHLSRTGGMTNQQRSNREYAGALIPAAMLANEAYKMIKDEDWYSYLYRSPREHISQWNNEITNQIMAPDNRPPQFSGKAMLKVAISPIVGLYGGMEYLLNSVGITGKQEEPKTKNIRGEADYCFHGRGDYMNARHMDFNKIIDAMKKDESRVAHSITANSTAMKSTVPMGNRLPPGSENAPTPAVPNPYDDLHPADQPLMQGLPIPDDPRYRGKTDNPVPPLQPGQPPNPYVPAYAGQQPTGFITGADGSTIPIYDEGGVNNPQYFDTNAVPTGYGVPDDQRGGVHTPGTPDVEPYAPSAWDNFWRNIWHYPSGEGTFIHN